MGRVIEFEGPYANLLTEYVEFRQALGFAMPTSSQRTLRHIASYLYARPLIPEIIDLERSEEISAVKGNEADATRQGRYVVLRRFCIYLNNKGITAYVPPVGGVRGRSTFIPRIITEHEMAIIIKTADKEIRNWPSMVLKLLWCTGLRIGEASALRLGDFNQDQQSLYITHAKHDRSRIIPIHESLAGELSRYIQHHVIARHHSSWLFPGSKSGSHHNKVAMGNCLRTIYRDAEVLTDKGDPIRTHDIRHSFAIKALENMVERGQDAYVTLPYLSAYMGHANIFDTEYYLRFLPSAHQDVIDCEQEVSHVIFGGDRQ